MKTLFKNAQILLGDYTIKKGCLLVEENKIAYIGQSEPTNVLVDKEIDVQNNLLMPGFVNAHCHTPSTVLRGVSDDKLLEEWLNDIVPREQNLTDDEVYWSTLLGILEYVRGGITCIEENFGRIKPLVNAIKISNIRARVSIGFPNFKVPNDFSLDEQLKIVEDAGLKPVCFAHSVYGRTEDEFAELTTFARKHNLAVSTHMSETLTEVGGCCVANNDLTPPELLEEYGFFDRPATVYHAVHCDKDDLEILANYDVNVVTNASSNLKLASGIAPIFAMQQKGINVAIGTDGAYSNNSYDMFKEMFLVATLNKATLNMANIINTKQVLDMATKNGAKALGFDDVGEIKVGNRADLILVDLTGVHHQPLNNIVSNLVYSAKSTDVYLTMVDGKILYENGKYYIGEDVEKIIAENIKTKNRLNKLEGEK